jgi:hypothetical protein
MTISLLLRVAPEALAAGRLAGDAQHVESGKRAVVKDAEELIAFLRDEPERPERPDAAVRDSD